MVNVVENTVTVLESAPNGNLFVVLPLQYSKAHFSGSFSLQAHFSG
jgi:hypothetical protein